MNNKKRNILYFFGLLAIAGSRVLYFFFGSRKISDTYGYFANAVIQAKEEEAVFSSGISCFYTGFLSDIFLFTGNRIEAAGVCQMVFQILWMILLSAGVIMLAGTAAGIAAGSVLALSPQVMESIFEISPDNFFMLHFSMILVILGCFYLRVQKEEWHGNIWDECYLMMTGIYLGVVCLWNYLGFFLIFAALFVLIKSSGEQKNAGFVLFPFLGLLAGFFASMVNESQITGNSMPGQAALWFSSFKVFPGRCQEMDTVLALWIICSLAAGGLCSLAIYFWRRGRQAVKAEDVEEAEKIMEVNENQDNYIVAMDGRKIRLLDNPLPVPKRHVKKEMHFDIEDVSGDMEELEDDFTPAVNEPGIYASTAALGLPPEQEVQAWEAREDEFDFQIHDGDDFDI